jgi:hypothetical protein
MITMILISMTLLQIGSGAGGAAELQFLRLLRVPGSLLVYGGERHNVFLGCLNCDPSDRDSIDNKNGEHGSPTGPYSIRNPRGVYGDKRFSDSSACNVSAKHPPVITDRDGHEYGTLTVNWTDPNRRQHPAINHWLSQEVCAGMYKP